MDSNKTKWGVSAGLLSMLCYFCGYYSLTACAVLFIIIVAFSDSTEAKKNAAQAIVFSVLMMIVQEALSRLGNGFINFLDYIASWFKYDSGNGFKNVISVLRRLNVLDWLSGVLNFVYFIITIVLVLGSKKGKQVKAPFVSKFVDKCFGDGQPQA